MKIVLRYCEQLYYDDGGRTAESHQQVMDEIKPDLDEARRIQCGAPRPQPGHVFLACSGLELEGNFNLVFFCFQFGVVVY